MLVQEVYDILLLHPYFSNLSEFQRYSALNNAVANLGVKELEYEIENDNKDYVTEQITVSDDRTFASDTGFWSTSSTTIADGKATYGGSSSNINRNNLLTISTKYKLIFEVLSGTSNFVLTYSDLVYPYASHTVATITGGIGTKVCYFTAESVLFRLVAVTGSTAVDNISLLKWDDVMCNVVSFNSFKYDNKLITGNSIKFPWTLTTKQKLFILNIALTKLGNFKSSKYKINNVEKALTHTKEYKSTLLNTLKWRVLNSIGIITNSSDRTEVGSAIRIEKSFYLTLQSTLNSSVVAARIEKVLQGILGCTLSWKYGLQKVYNLNLNGAISYISKQATKESDLSFSASVNWRIYGAAQFTKENNLSLGSTVNWIIT